LILGWGLRTTSKLGYGLRLRSGVTAKMHWSDGNLVFLNLHSTAAVTLKLIVPDSQRVAEVLCGQGNNMSVSLNTVHIPGESSCRVALH
jgi:hypothetical protein